MSIEVLNKDGKIYVKGYYDSSFIISAKQINGKWQNPYWVFDEENKDLVENIVLKYYGYKAYDEEIKIEYNPKDFTEDNYVIVGKKKTAERRKRRTPVVFFDTIVVSGGFNGWSGSEKNPQLGTDVGTILRTTVSKTFLSTLTDEDKSKIKIINKVSKDELLKRKHELEKCLAEINKQLREMDNNEQ